MLKKLSDLLRSKYKPGAGEYLELDVEDLTKLLDIDIAASQRGAKNQPPANSKERDEVEHTIISTIHSIAADAQSRTLDQASTYHERIRTISSTGTATDMHATARRSESKMSSEIVRVHGELTQARREVSQRAQALKDFKEKHKLTRPPLPERNKLFLVAILLLLFLIETLPNASLLSSGSAQGVLGAYGIAITFSFLNLSSGFIAGRFGLTLLAHINKFYKFFGALITVFLSCVAIAINFAVAHFRDVVSSGLNIDNASIEVMKNITANPFHLGDILAFAMIGLGFLFAFIAMMEGWLWDDPYPDYGAVTRCLHDAERNLNGLIEEKMEDLKELEEECFSEIEQIRNSVRDKRGSVPTIVHGNEVLLKKYNNYLVHLQDVGNQLLKKYYYLNRINRTDEAPHHFDKNWKLEGFEINLFQDIAQYSKVDEFEKVDKALTDSMERLQLAYEDAINWIKEFIEMPIEQDVAEVGKV